MATTANLNVGFLRGTQAKINEILTEQTKEGFDSSIIREGAFYITSDTNRMYIGKKDTNDKVVLASLNAGIIVVETYAELLNKTAEQGAFYYIKGTGQEGEIANVLCIRSGDTWVQVNSINSLDKITIGTKNIETGEDGVTGASVTASITDKIDTIEGSYTVKGNSGISVSSNTTGNGLEISAEQIQVGVSASTNKASISLNESGLVDSSKNLFNIELASDTSSAITANSDTSTITLTTQDTLVTAVSTTVADETGGGVKVTTDLTDSGGNNITAGSFFIKSDNLTIETETNSDSVLKIDADPIEVSTEYDDIDKIVTVSLDSALMKEDKNSFILKAGTHVTLSQDSTSGAIVIESTDTNTINSSLAFNTAVNKDDPSKTEDGFDVVLTDSEGDSITGRFNPEVRYGHTVTEGKSTTTATAKFNTGSMALDVYTASEIDAIIEKEFLTFNAMEYQGVITALPTDLTKIKNGYTYLAGSSFTIDTTNVAPGGLIIAKGDEDENGYISDDITWEYVAANLVDTTYKFVAVDGGIQLKDNSDDSIGSLVIAGSDYINVTSTYTATNPQDQSLTIEHKSYDGTLTETESDMPVNKEYTIPVVSSLDIENGHIKGYTIVNHTFVDTVGTIADSFEISSTADGDKKGVSIKNTVTLAAGDDSSSGDNDSFSLVSTNKNLIIETAAEGSKQINFSLIWENF